MITPRFRLDQSEKDVTIFIHAPYTDVNATEVHIDQDQVCFYSSPYYLRLHLPGPVLEDDRSKGSFDAEKGEFIISLPKATPGQHFNGLDMVNALLNPSKPKISAAIEVIGGELAAMEEIKDFDWFVNQEMEKLPDPTINNPTYGFANTASGVFQKLESELPDLLDLPNPDSTPSSERAALQLAAENTHFSAEHYLADWAEEGQLVAPLLLLKMSWEVNEDENLTPDEQEQLLRLPRREFLPLTESEQRSALLGLAELVFCWAHEQRCSDGDPGPEAARSVRRLSATFSWLRQFHSVQELTLNCVRRALCVPLYRNWNLALLTLKDTQQLLSKGRVRILKVLLNLLTWFGQCESHHVLSQLYLEPYCLWLQQSVSDAALISLSHAIEKSLPAKEAVGWELEELESAGRLAMEEETSKQLAAQVRSRLHVRERTRDSDDSSEDGSESSSGDYTCSSHSSDGDSTSDEEE